MLAMEGLTWRTSSLSTQGLAPPPLFGHSAVLLSHHFLVVFGGAVASREKHVISGDLSILNLSATHWTLVSSRLGDLPCARASHACIAVEPSRMLVHGGVVGAGALADDNVYLIEVDFALDKAKAICLSTTGKKPCPRYAHSMAGVGSKVFLYGGIANAETLSDLWTFENFQWTEIAIAGECPSSRCYHSASAYTNHLGRDFLLVFGGRDKDQKALGDLWTLTASGEGRWKWVWVTTQSQGRHMHSMVVVGEDCYIVGGKAGHEEVLPSLKIDLGSCRTAVLPSYSAYRQVCFYYSGSLHLFGGYQGQNCLTNCIALIELQSPVPLPIRRDRPSTTPQRLCPGKLHLSPFVTISSAKAPDHDHSAPVKRVALSRLLTESKKLQTRSSSPAYSIVSTASDSAQNFVIYTFLRPAEGTEKQLPREVVLSLLDSAAVVLAKDSGALALREPVKVFSGLKGQLEDLLRYFREFGEPSEAPFVGDLDSTDYVFAGEHVGPGPSNLELLCLLLALKVKHSESVYLLRSSQPQRLERLEAECSAKYPSEVSLSMKFLGLIAQMPTQASISSSICCHTGPYTSPSVSQDCGSPGLVTLVCEEATRGGLEICDRGFTVRFASAPSLRQEPRRPGCVLVVTKALQVVPKFLPPSDS